jgi:thioredoxin-like negative regulator of GroEL
MDATAGVGPWSASSRQLKQDLEPAVFPPGLKVLSVQVEDASPIVTALAITSVPYLALLHAGLEVARHPGNAPLLDLLGWVQAWHSGQPERRAPRHPSPVPAFSSTRRPCAESSFARRSCSTCST